MVVGNVMPVMMALMELVIVIWVIATLSTGVQAEYIRFHYANWSLIKIPGQPSDYTEAMLKSFLSLADVMPTGYHAARVADVKTRRQGCRN